MIDLYGNVVLTQAQIKKRGQRMIKQKWNPTAESNLQRKMHGLSQGRRPSNAADTALMDRYQTDLETVESQVAQAYLDNDLLRRTIAYERSLVRLDRHLVSAGKPSEPIYEEQNDPETGEPIQVQVGTVPEILPVEPTITQPTYDAESNVTGEEVIENPIITKDLSERESAQTTVDNVSQDAIDLSLLR